MNLLKKEIPNGLVIKVIESRVDMSISRKFKDDILELIKDHPKIVVLDLEETEYFDSSALGALVTLYRTIKGYGGEIRLTHLNSTLTTLMKLSKLDIMFKIFDTIDEAIA